MNTRITSNAESIIRLILIAISVIIQIYVYVDVQNNGFESLTSPNYTNIYLFCAAVIIFIILLAQLVRNYFGLVVIGVYGFCSVDFIAIDHTTSKAFLVSLFFLIVYWIFFNKPFKVDKQTD